MGQRVPVSVFFGVIFNLAEIASINQFLILTVDDNESPKPNEGNEITL